LPKRERDNRLSPSPRQRERWAALPGFQPHAETVSVDRDSWTGRPAVYRHASPSEIEPLRRAAQEQLLTVWTVDHAAPRPGEVHLNRYTMTVAQALEFIAGCARGRWVEEVIHIEAGALPT
jgi:hypothetical protein